MPFYFVMPTKKADTKISAFKKFIFYFKKPLTRFITF